MEPRALYVHVPFCARRCSYCDFAVAAVRRPPVDAWLEAIDGELARVAAREGWSLPLELETIYVGGGTPSLLGVGAMVRLRERLERYAVWSDSAVEWTAEANPESFDGELARDWRGAGVNRVSIGVQTFHEPALRWMGRLHGPDRPGEAVAAARTAGIGNVSVDLIFGLPARLERDWDADLERVIALEPEHVSLYGLTAEAATPLGRWVQAGRERMADEEAYEEEYLRAVDRLSAAGFVHYEVSNFARPGQESRHNGAYWRGDPYVGLGPGAHSLLGGVRRWNVRDWEAYRSAVTEGRSPEEDSERPDEDAVRLERVWLGLRTRDGLTVADAPGATEELVAGWQRRGWAVLVDGRARLTARGWLLLDRLAVDFDAALAGTNGRMRRGCPPAARAASLSGPDVTLDAVPRSGSHSGTGFGA